MSQICMSYDGQETCVPTEMFWAVAVVECMLLICLSLLGISLGQMFRRFINRILKRTKA